MKGLFCNENVDDDHRFIANDYDSNLVNTITFKPVEKEVREIPTDDDFVRVNKAMEEERKLRSTIGYITLKDKNETA